MRILKFLFFYGLGDLAHMHVSKPNICICTYDITRLKKVNRSRVTKVLYADDIVSYNQN